MDPKIQIKHVDTKNQLADKLTKGGFTRDEWDRISRCFLAAIFFQTESRRFASGEAETNEFGVKEPLDYEKEILRKIRVIQTARGIKELDQSCVSSSGRNLTRNINQNPTMCSQERQNKMTLNRPAPGNWGGEMNLQAQPAPGHWSEVRTSKSEGRRWNSTICKSPTIDIP